MNTTVGLGEHAIHLSGRDGIKTGTGAVATDAEVFAGVEMFVSSMPASAQQFRVLITLFPEGHRPRSMRGFPVRIG